jgi:hypothetical protein
MRFSTCSFPILHLEPALCVEDFDASAGMPPPAVSAPTSANALLEFSRALTPPIAWEEEEEDEDEDFFDDDEDLDMGEEEDEDLFDEDEDEDLDEDEEELLDDE